MLNTWEMYQLKKVMIDLCRCLQPITEFSTHGIASLAFVKLFPPGQGDHTYYLEGSEIS